MKTDIQILPFLRMESGREILMAPGALNSRIFAPDW